MSATYLDANYIGSTIALIPAKETISSITPGNPGTFTFDIPDGAWAAFDVFLYAQSGSDYKPGIIDTSQRLIQVKATASFGGQDFRANYLVNALNSRYLDSSGNQARSYNNDNQISTVYHNSSPLIIGECIFASSASYYDAGTPPNFADGKGMVGPNIQQDQMQQNYPCLPFSPTGDTLKITVTPDQVSGGIYYKKAGDAGYDPGPVTVTLTNCSALLVLQSIAPLSPVGTMIPNTTGYAGLSVGHGASSVDIPLIHTYSGFINETVGDGWRPFSYKWQVIYLPDGSLSAAPHGRQIPADRIGGQGTASITWEFDNFPAEYAIILIICLVTNSPYPHEVNPPNYGTISAYLQFSAQDSAPAAPPGRANLSAPGPRFIRAEDVFTKAAPPKPAGIAAWRGKGPVPKLAAGTLWEVAAAVVTTNPADTSPALALDSRGLLYCAFSRAASGAYLKRSDDGAATWNTEAISNPNGGSGMAIPGGILPALASGSGTLLLVALVGTDSAGYTVWSCSKGPGSAAFGPAKAAVGITLPSMSKAALKAEKSAPAICRAEEGPNRWILSLVVKGETATSEWWSANNGEEWTRIPTS